MGGTASGLGSSNGGWAGESPHRRICDSIQLGLRSSATLPKMDSVPAFLGARIAAWIECRPDPKPSRS